MRQQIYQQLGNSLDELPGLREGQNVFSDLRIPARQRPEFGYEMRIRQKADIEEQIGVAGHSVLETETYTGYENILIGLLLLKAFRDVGAEFMNIEPGGVDD